MLNWALTFFILSILAGVFGFGGMAGTFAWGAQVLFVGFVILTIVFAVAGRKAPPV